MGDPPPTSHTPPPRRRDSERHFPGKELYCPSPGRETASLRAAEGESAKGVPHAPGGVQASSWSPGSFAPSRVLRHGHL